MYRGLMQIRVPDGKVAEILNRLSAARDEIYRCYDELELLGVIEFVKTETLPAATGSEVDG